MVGPRLLLERQYLYCRQWSFLESIALLYFWLNARLSSPKGKGWLLRKEDVRVGSEYCFLSIEAEHKGWFLTMPSKDRLG